MAIPLPLNTQCAARLLVITLAMPIAAFAYDWRQFNGDPAHSGNNTAETAISRANVGSLALKFQITLPDVVDGAPVVLQSVATSSGVRDLVFAATRDGRILALDANTGEEIWRREHGAGDCLILAYLPDFGPIPCYTTSSPAIDPDRRYVYAYGLDGYVHKYQVADGVEITAGGWPQLTTTKGFEEKGSSALAVAGSKGKSYLYVTHAGYPGDGGDYQGHVTTIELATGIQRVFNATCSDQTGHFVHAPGEPDCPNVQTAIWARPGVIYDAATDRIYMTTGNGRFAGDTDGYGWGDSVFALYPDGTGSGGKPLDSYTPVDFERLDQADLDLGSTAPAILPVPSGSRIAHLALQSGKDAKLRLIDLSNMSGRGGPGYVGGEVGEIVDLPQGGEVLTQPAVWVNPVDATTWVFIANGNGIAGLRLAVGGDGAPRLETRWQSEDGGTSPLIANHVLYYAATGVMRALEPATGAVLWKSDAIGSVHWESPVVANGVLYVTDEQARLTAFAPPPTTLKTAVIEFYNASLDHYFMTALAAEIDALDFGQQSGWTRTGFAFNAYPDAMPNTNPVCRFYLPPGSGDSHFYSASAAECDDVRLRFASFEYESPAVFHIALPDASTGACPAGTSAVYRVWNKRADTNHRYTASRAIRDRMVASGWIAEEVWRRSYDHVLAIGQS